MRALVLAGGGTRGDFEVGVIRFLYERHGWFPELLCSTSVGSINSAKLAEGPIGDPGAAGRLADIWLGLQENTDMWREQPEFREFREALRPVLRLAYMDLPEALYRAPAMLLSFIATSEELEELADAPALFNLEPIEAMLRDPAHFDPAKVAASGIRLRAAVVALGGTQIDFVTEDATLLSNGDSTGDLATGVLASASIPVAFPAVEFAGDHWADGGVRELLPFHRAIAEGADDIITVVPSPALVREDYRPAISWIAQRAFDLMYDEMTAPELVPPPEKEAELSGRWKLIRPRVVVHDILTIDPGLMRMSMAYGWMCAHDEMTGHPRAAELKAWADEILAIRHRVWELEFAANGWRRPSDLLPVAPMTRPVPAHEAWSELRGLKREVRRLLSCRLAVGGDDAIPPGSDEAFISWDQHRPSSGVTLHDTPWLETSSLHEVLPAEPPPLSLLAPQGTYGEPSGYDLRGAHRLFRDLDGDIREIIDDPASGGTVEVNLTALTGAPRAAGDPRAYVTDGVPRVLYRSTGGLVVEIWLDPNDGQWKHFALSAHVGGPPAVGDPVGYVTDGVPRVLYRTDLDTIAEIWLDPADGRWKLFALSDHVNGPAAAGDPWAHMVDGVPRVDYRTDIGTIAEIYLDPADGQWKLFALSDHVNGPTAAGDPHGYVAGTLRVDYRADDGHIYEMWIDPADGQWKLFALSLDVGAPAAAGDPFGFEGGGTPRVHYRADDGRLIEISINPGNGQWAWVNLGRMAGGPPAGSDPWGLVSGAPRVVYRDRDGIDLWELSSASGSWRSVRLTRQGI